MSQIWQMMMAMVTKLMTMMMKLHVEVESDPWVRSRLRHHGAAP